MSERKILKSLRKKEISIPVICDHQTWMQLNPLTTNSLDIQNKSIKVPYTVISASSQNETLVL
jgi:hypothetical protein